MSNREIKFTIMLPPVTKKNHSRIATFGYRCPRCGKGEKTKLLPSEAYLKYEEQAGYFIRGKLRNMNISQPVNVKCLYYMPTERRVDLPNLLNATDDVLVKYKVVADDNSDIIATHDGSRVIKGDKNPRTEITITFYDSLS